MNAFTKTLSSWKNGINEVGTYTCWLAAAGAWRKTFLIWIILINPENDNFYLHDLTLFDCKVYVYLIRLFSTRKTKLVLNALLIFEVDLFPHIEHFILIKVETSFEQNQYHLGHKLRCTLPLIQAFHRCQKQPPKVFYKKSYSWKKTFRNIHRKEIALKSLFNKVACIQGSYFIKKRIQRTCTCINFSFEHCKIFKNTADHGCFWGVTYT